MLCEILNELEAVSGYSLTWRSHSQPPNCVLICSLYEIRTNVDIEKLYKDVKIDTFVKHQRLRWMERLKWMDDARCKPRGSELQEVLLNEIFL